MRQSSREGLKLLHKMQAALGGAEKIAAIHDYEETVDANTWNASGAPLGSVRKRTRWMHMPNLLRLDQLGPRDTYVLYFDGETGSGWEMLPDVKGPNEFRTIGKAMELVGGELEFAKSYLSGFEFNLWLADRMGYTVTSPASRVLRIQHDGAANDYTLDPKTSLPVKSTGASLADANRAVSAYMSYEAWTEVAGVLFPTKRTNYHNGAKLGEITSAAIRVNTGLTRQELAAKPADFAPDLPDR